MKSFDALWEIKKGGLDTQPLERQIQLKYKNIQGLAIFSGEGLLYEGYFNKTGANDSHNVASVCKSILSALVGIALEEDALKDLNQEIIDFYPQYEKRPSPTIKELLTMNAVYTWSKGDLFPEPLDRIRRQGNWIDYILRNLLPSQRNYAGFHYSTAGTHLLSGILTKATGVSARDYANAFLFKPLGIDPISDCQLKTFHAKDIWSAHRDGWLNDPQGNSTGGFGLSLKLKDLMKFGYLYLNSGEWEGSQIVPRHWIECTLSPASEKGDYGYLWWLKKVMGYQTCFAAGSGGNLLMVIPQLDIVIGITAKIVMKPNDSIDLIADYILPTIVTFLQQKSAM